MPNETVTFEVTCGAHSERFVGLGENVWCPTCVQAWWQAVDNNPAIGSMARAAAAMNEIIRRSSVDKLPTGNAQPLDEVV